MIVHQKLYQTWIAAAVCLACTIFPNVSDAQIDFNDGVVSSKELPDKTISDTLVVLDVPHIKQKPYFCVPTSCSMILRYLGKSVSPGALKKAAESGKPKEKQNIKFTYWKDIQRALKSQGHNWEVKSFAKTETGFENGLDKIKTSLRNKLPVMIEVHLGSGHSFVVIGFDEPNQKVFVRDPSLDRSKIRVLSYQQLLKNWHNHKYSNSRSALFPSVIDAKNDEKGSD